MVILSLKSIPNRRHASGSPAKLDGATQDRFQILLSPQPNLRILGAQTARTPSQALFLIARHKEMTMEPARPTDSFDFDEVLDRRGTNSVKWDFVAEHGRDADCLPLWVADMDFRTPPCVRDALRHMVDGWVLGYSEVKREGPYFTALRDWFATRHGWEVQPDWLVKTPGVVFALAMAVQAFTQPGDGVIIQPPVYYPFFGVIRDNGREVMENPLRLVENADGGLRYEMDFEGLERLAARPDVTMMILCSPHNPVGRVWTREELERVGQICERHGVLVASDEIHCDFAFDEHPHTPFLIACPQLADRAIVCTAASKSFNIAGLQTSNIFIPNAELRARFKERIHMTGHDECNAAGLVATQAAYAHGAPWLDACRAYMRANLDFLRDYLRRELPALRLVEPQGTYFAWIDCSGLGLSDEELEHLVSRQAKLWLDAGSIFGKGSGQFERVVLACPRATLEQALDRLATAVRA